MDEATATKVPQTGSFFNSPPDCCDLGAAGGLLGSPVICEKARISNTVTCRMKSAAMKTRNSRKILLNMAWTPRVPIYFFFVAPFFGADGFLYSVAICAPSMASIPLDDSA